MQFLFYCFIVVFYYILPALLSSEYCLFGIISIVGAINVTVPLLSVLLVIVVLLYERNTIKSTFKNIKFTFFLKHTFTP